MGFMGLASRTSRTFILVAAGLGVASFACSGLPQPPRYGVIRVQPYEGRSLPGLDEVGKKHPGLVVVGFRGAKGSDGYHVPHGFALKPPSGERIGCLYYRDPRAIGTDAEWKGHFFLDPQSGNWRFDHKPLFVKKFGADFEMDFLFAVDGPVTPEWLFVYSDKPFFSSDRDGEQTFAVTKAAIDLPPR